MTLNIVEGADAPDYRVTIYTTCNKPKKINANVTFRPILDILNAEKHDHDVLITVISNGLKADKYVAILQKHGGVAHVHDGICNHLLIGLWYNGQLSKSELYDVYERWYGREMRLYLESREGWWDTRVARQVTGLGEVLGGADGIIVNSDFLRARILKYYPELPVEVVQQRYYDVPVSRKRRKLGSKTVLRTFGFIGPNKGLFEALEAVADVQRDFPLHFEIIGQGPIQMVYDLLASAKRMGIGKSVNVVQSLSQSAFLRRMAETELAVQLRDPTFGECSSICQRMLFAGVPMVVSDDGYYAELPDFVPKVPVPLRSDDIRKAISQLVRDSGRSDYANENSAYIRENYLDQESYANVYFSAALSLVGK